ncbi:hypothetical protein EDD85DRAFT_213015 [Armillaria nabsnona]|nr:hypothetical protein EDD85DRAFT_213015 [Armillaria nabsnona]
MNASTQITNAKFSWPLWDRKWQVVSMPILCAIGGTVIKVMQMFSDIRILTDSPEAGQFAPVIDWSLIYVILMLATTLICTLLIIYRIVREAREMSASRKIIEMLIQSSAIYSLSLIIYLALVSRNLEASFYADTFVAYVKAIAPTLLVGRVLSHANASSRRQQMIALRENHPPLVGCFREEDANNS